MKGVASTLVTSDKNGEFVIQAGPDDILEVRVSGYQFITVDVKGQIRIDIELRGAV